MQGEKIDKVTENNQNNIIASERRKRINRIKTVIIVIIICLMVLPTISCIYLGIQVNRLQNQVNDLLTIHGKSDLTYNKGDNYAFAAEYTGSNIDYKENNNLHNNTDEYIPDSIISNNLDNSEAKEQYLEGTQAEDIIQVNENNLKESELDQVVDSSTENELINQQDSSEKDNVIDKMNDAQESNSEEAITKPNTGIYAGKKVYLTFDDGPSVYTEEILDILAQYQVKATFFVIGKTDKYSKKMYQRIIEEGHVLGMHSYSHVYKYIYKSLEDFDKDFTKLWNLLYDTTGYKPTIFRFPGGSANRVNENGMEEFINYLNEKSIVYYDWNVVNGDETGVDYTKEQLIDNVLDGVAMKKVSIVLMHDSITRKATKDSLTEILDELISGGAEILPLDKEVTPIQQIKFDSMK